MKRRDVLNLSAALALGFAVLPSSAFSQQSDVDGAKEASRAFYAALAVIDDGSALSKIVAHTPYITFTGPRDKTVSVGYDAWKTYWAESNKMFKERNVSLSDQRIHVNGNLAWEMGQESGSIKLQNDKEAVADYTVTNVYEKIDGRWLMVSHHVQPKPQ